MTTLEVTYGSSDLIEVTYGGADEVTIRYAGVAGPQGETGATGATGAGVPVGGTTGQVLAKASGTDYDTGWVTRPTIVNTDGDPGQTIYVGSIDPDGTYTLAAGDVWIEVP